MATVYSSTVQSCWRAYLTYTVTDNGDSVTIAAKGGFGSYNWGFALTGVDCTLSCTGQTSKSASGSVSTSTGATTNVQLASTSWTIAKGSTAKSVTVKSYVNNDSGYKGGTATASTTVTIPAKAGYTVTYNANGGTGAPTSQTVAEGASFTVSTQTPYKDGYRFLGWSTSSTATSAAFSPGETITGVAASITLYAVWAVAYGAPTIKSLSAERCSSSGTFAALGTYAKVTFDWTCEASVSSIKVSWSSTSTTVSASGTSGSAYKVIGGSFSTSSSYTITVTVTDIEGNTASASCPLGTGVYAWSVLAGGSGFAVGKNAERSGFDCGFNEAYFNNVEVAGTLTAAGLPIFKDIYSSGSTGTISLTESASNFDLVLIVFEDAAGYQNSTIAQPGGYATLISSYMNPGVYHENKTVYVSGSTITASAGGRSYIAVGGENVNAASATSYISITGVYGISFG